MTIASTTAKSGPYSGNGVTTVFNYGFKVFDDEDLVVTLLNTAGAEVVQTLTVNYTVTGVGADAGGSVVMVTPPASGEQLVITRAVPLLQELDLQNRKAVNPDLIERGLDLVTQMIQDSREQLSRSVKVPVTSATDPDDLIAELKADAAAAATSANEAEGFAAQAGRPFETRTAFLAANVPPVVTRSSFFVNGQTYAVVRDATGPIVQDNGQRWRPDGDVAPQHFGAVGDGVADDTAQVRAMHNWCNAHHKPVSYSGLAGLRIQADAKIPVNTDVDFAGIPITLIGGVVPLSPWQPTTTYIVSDPETPLNTTQGVVAGSDLRAGSSYPTRGIFDGSGFAHIYSDFPMPPRSPGGVDLQYQQSFRLVEGRAILPLAEDVSNFPNVTVRYRKASKFRVRLSNINIVDDGWNSLVFLDVRRCGVDIDGVSFYETETRALTSIDQVIRIWDSADYTLSNVSARRRPTTGSDGTYVITLTRAPDGVLTNVHPAAGETGWSSTGNNHLNGLKLVRCSFDRFDAHQGGFNVTAVDCIFTVNGMQFGSGGGIIQFDRCRFINSRAFIGRTDYGNYFSSGEIILNDCVWEYDTSPAPLVDFGDTQANRYIGSSKDCVAPSVHIRNLLIRSRQITTTTPVILDMRVRPGAVGRVRAPEHLSFHDVNIAAMSGIVSPIIRVDMGSFDQEGYIRTSAKLVVGNWRTLGGAFYTALAGGLRDIEAVLTPVTKANWRIDVFDSGNFGIDLKHNAPQRIRVRDTDLTWLLIPNGMGSDIEVRDCTFEGDSSTNGFKVGGDDFGSVNSTRLFSVRFRRPVDVSEASLIVGCIVPTGSILPTGVTQGMALQGWGVGISA